jgi:hypothetical protein
MDTLRLIATLLPVSLTSGINLYLTILIAGLSIRFGWVQGVHPSLTVLSSWPVIIVAGIFYLLQFLADKIPFVDNIWDFIHTFIRPVGAAMLGVAVLGKADPSYVVVGALVGGGLALITHSAKAGVRATLNTASPAENISNIGLSVAEDIGVGALTFTALKYPYLATGIGLILLALIVIFIPQLLRWSWSTLAAIIVGFKAGAQKLIGVEVKSDTLPIPHRVLLNHKLPDMAGKCRAQKIYGADSRRGYLSITDHRVAFTYNTMFGERIWSIPEDAVQASYLHHQSLADVLELHYLDAKNKARVARFVFLKDRSALAEQFWQQLKPTAG